MMRKNFLLLILLSLIYSQDETKSAIKSLDPRKYESWTIEDQKYRIRIEDLINKQYRIMHPDDSLLVDIKSNDKLIIVESLLENNPKKKLYEIWYGVDGNYTIIPREKISWIFGTEFQRLILDKNYFYLESNVVFYESEQGRIANSFQSVTDIWTQRSLIVSTEKILAKIPKRPDLGVAINFSQPLLGYPKGTMNSIDIGLVLRLAEIGIQVPFDGYKYPIYNLKESNFSSEIGDKQIYSGFGGYGRFNIVGLNGNFSIQSFPTNIDSVTKNKSFSDSIYVSTLKGNIATKINIIKSEFNNPKARLAFYPGVYFQRFGKYPNKSNETNGGINYRAINFTNFYGRIEYISLIKRGFPRIESYFQIMVDHSTLFSLTFNISKSLGIRLDHFTYLDDEIKNIVPESVLDIGIRLKLDY